MNNDNIERLNLNNKEIILIGTAHVSKESVQQVKEVIITEQPDSVCVELDQQRYNSLKDGNKWDEMDIFTVIKEKKSLFLLVNLIMSSFQKRMAKQFGINPGQEMIQGIQSAREMGANLVLADRNIQVTFKRVWRGLGIIEKVKLIFQIISMIFFNDKISEEEMKELKTDDSLTVILSEIGDKFPGVKKHLIDERDQYLSYKIKNAPGDKIVAILGAAHLPGVKKEIEKEQDMQKLLEVPPKGRTGKYITITISVVIIAIIIYTFFINRSTGIKQLGSWVLWNGSLSAVGVLLARGHLLSILTSFVVAPISSLSPFMAAGWFAGLTESLVRRPQVKDFKDLSNIISFKGFLENKVTRVLLVVVLANLGSVLGTTLGGIDVIKLFIKAVN